MEFGTLIPKLRKFLEEDYKLPKAVRSDLDSLRTEMERLEVLVRKMVELSDDQQEGHARIWINKFREVAYATEDCIDRFMLSMGSNSDPGPEFLHKTLALLKKTKARHRINIDIENIKEQLRNLPDPYGLHLTIGNPFASTTVDPRLSLTNQDDHPTQLIGAEEKKKLIGVEEKSEELSKRLLSDEGNNQEELKILSIFGFAGVGKTTLAKAVYDKMQTQPFDFKAIVSVGPDPKPNDVLHGILRQINKEKYSGVKPKDEMTCIQEIRVLLENKRYFIIVDDIWDIRSWEVIRYSFVDSKCRSIIITTTRIKEVATRAGGVYELEPLSHDSSVKLLHMKLIGCEVKFSSEPILQKCGGVPLAIITIASLLSSKSENWHMVVSGSNFWAADDIDVNKARMTILLSYYNLSNLLRVCLLHLSIFPKNYMIRKDTLIWKWIAEGFIPENPRAGLFEMAEGCFNELINRNMIQPVEISHNGDIIGCRVHDMVADIICSMAKEKYFITVLNGDEQHTSSEYNTRRFALHGEVIEWQQQSHMSGVRSFNAIKCDISKMPSLTSFELLRVLAIEDCSSFQLEGNAYSLDHIGRLLLLRYLGLSRTSVSKLPDEVGNLKYLQILDVRQTRIRELPMSVSLLSRLKCLRADGGSTSMPDCIGKLTSLEELSLSDVSSCPNFVKEISKLTMLRELKIWIQVLDERSKNALIRSLSNLQEIQVLHLHGRLLIEDDQWDWYVPPRQLHRLSLRIKLLRLPRWINSSHLPTLSHLSVDLRVVETDDMAILGSFPGLITLELFIPNSVSLDVKGRNAFPKLRHCYTSGMLRFLEGAAPCLESVHFNVMSALSGASFHCGFLEKLPLLKEVRVEIFYSGVHGAVEVEEELRRAIGDHPNHPILHVSQY